MKITKSRGVLISILASLALLFATACARVPSNERVTRILRANFKKYAKKYPETVYGKHRIKEIDVTSQEEIHKHLVAVDTFITFDDGGVQRISATVEKGPLGWRFVSWENVGGTE